MIPFICSNLIIIFTFCNALHKPPNIVLFLLDDQDILINGMQAFPKTMEIFSTNTIQFINAFASTPVCCVSRGSILTGRYVHNSQIFNNSIYGGCGSFKFIKQQEPYSYASYLQQSNYRTFFSGKYLNLYGMTDQMPYTHIPKGWTDWYGLIGDAVYYNYNLSINGKYKEYHGYNGNDDYLPFVMANKAKTFLTNIAQQTEHTPFLLSLAFPSGHAPWTPPNDYLYILESDTLIRPKLVNFNYFNSDGNNNDKGPVLRMQKPMNPQQILMADKVYKARHATFMAVDDIIYDLYQTIKDIGQIDNTYFIETSDHGFHIGQYGMWFGKKLLYETDLRIPLYIHGPNINTNKNIKTTSKTALTIDIAPTIVELATGSIPDTMDGESLMKYINLNKNEEMEIFNSKQEFLVEYFGETDFHHETLELYNERIIHCPSHTDYIYEIQCDLWNNTFKCIRIIDGSKQTASINNDNIGEIFCEYTCFNDGYEETECEIHSVESKGEYYNLDIDPWQLKNGFDRLNNDKIKYFKDLINTHLDCNGEVCRQLRTNNVNSNVEIDGQMKNLSFEQMKNNMGVVFIGCSVVFGMFIWILIYFKCGCCLRFCYGMYTRNEYMSLNAMNTNNNNIKYNAM